MKNLDSKINKFVTERIDTTNTLSTKGVVEFLQEYGFAFCNMMDIESTRQELEMRYEAIHGRPASPEEVSEEDWDAMALDLSRYFDLEDPRNGIEIDAMDNILELYGLVDEDFVDSKY